MHKTGQVADHLIKSASKEALRQNIATEVKAGKPANQAAAIAYQQAREARRGK